MTSKNGWMNDWKQSQDEKDDQIYNFKRTEPLIPTNPLLKFTLTELLNEVVRRVSELDGVKPY
jgi:hypothetical protein